MFNIAVKMNRRSVLFLCLTMIFACENHPAFAQLLTGFGAPPSPVQNEDAPSSPAPFLTGAISRIVPKADNQDAPPAQAQDGQEPVDLQADRLDHDDKNQIVTASGNVMLSQAGHILRADQIVYDVRNDTAHAKGHVVLNEENGDIHYADRVDLTDHMKNGFIEQLKSQMNDGSRFTAEKGERVGGTKTTMEEASYTPCEACAEHPEKPPLWQIAADRVEHDETEHKVNYKNAKFEVYGVPVAYTPYFSHPDGTIKQKSGFLTPSVGYRSSLGAFVDNSYYWGIAPQQDATLGVRAMTSQSPILTGQYRRRWDNAQTEVNGGITYAGREDRVSGKTVSTDDEVRGHVLSKSLWDIDDKWRSGLNIEYASDDQYMRQYDINSKDVLENELYAERFSGRDYASGRILKFQDIRVRDSKEDQPEIVPELSASFIGEPDSVPLIGGRWMVEGSTLNLRREGSNPDMNRASVNLGYDKRLVSDYGFLTNVSGHVRSDAYYARDREGAAETGRDSSTTNIRNFPYLQAQTSYPLVKPFENGVQATVEPIAAITLAPNIDINEQRIPNEDSRDVQIDASNLFEANRFPGLDRIEDQSHATYGLRTGLYDADGNAGDLFFGQSFRFNQDDNPFPEGSGLNTQASDYVGQITAKTLNYDLNYRFQLAQDNLSSQRHEVFAAATWDQLTLSTQYLFAKGLGGTELDESREQISGALEYNFDEEWRARASATEDLGVSPGLRAAAIGIDHFGQCFFWALTAQKNFTDDSSGQSDTEILYRLGLKNLGDFLESPLKEKRLARDAPS